MHEGKQISSSIGKVFKKCLNSACLPKKNYNKQPKITDNDKKAEDERIEIENNRNTALNEQSMWNDVKECLDDLIQKVLQQEEKKPKEETTSIISLSDSDEDKRCELEN